MNRTSILKTKLNELKNNPWYGSSRRQLKKNEIEIVISFIDQYSELNADDFELKINRFFLDTKDKPKRFTLIQEILSVLNTQTRNEREPQ